MAMDDSIARSVTRHAMSAEMLDAETELALARAWRDDGCERSLHRLVNAYMRLAVSMASKYRRYGASMPDLIQEAGVGLMKAAEKFDPERGVRFSTYAVWWIKASIQDYVMRNWSMVRTGSTSSQKALFFNLRRVKAKLEREGQGLDPVSGQQMREMIAIEVGVPLRDVEMMEARLSGSDFSLNAQQAGDEGREWVEALEDDGPRAEETVSADVDLIRVRGWIADAMDALTTRERMIVIERKMRDDPRTLESLGNELGLSKERIRQLEAQALKKLRKRLEANNGASVEMLALA
ncbi:RNA polymerase factor sigma-32 [Pontivivens nitratireducens]|uniref:RNA polymerase factor sigma-32 n=1 Tax=Pontivivens nitratireducens TaxID=2758038 RepID=A0A6G7VPM6_9RHOB|nr:RNA polymerase factor sigma-32 [Pontibrevibacter nitratireducens]QIK41825.1 RNA polymerase factor sigma-32 [Pontibrevibacter nitratireducens]